MHKEAKKDNFRDFFLYGSDAEAEDMADGAVTEIAPESAVGNMNGAATGSTAMDEAIVEENTSTSVNKDHGTTNTQEKDVDEGDIIKTDGNYLYIANKGENNSISIHAFAFDIVKKFSVEPPEINFSSYEIIFEMLEKSI